MTLPPSFSDRNELIRERERERERDRGYLSDHNSRLVESRGECNAFARFVHVYRMERVTNKCETCQFPSKTSARLVEIHTFRLIPATRRLAVHLASARQSEASGTATRTAGARAAQRLAPART